MKKYLPAPVLFTAGILLPVFAVLFAGMMLLHVRLLYGPVSLGFMAPALAFVAERSLPPRFGTEMQDIVLSRDGPGRYRLSFTDVVLYGPDRNRLVFLPRLDLFFAPDDVRRGQFGPAAVFSGRSYLYMTRESLSGSFFPERSSGRDCDGFFSGFTGIYPFPAPFSEAVFKNIEIMYADETVPGPVFSSRGSVSVLHIRNIPEAGLEKADFSSGPFAGSVREGFSPAAGTVSVYMEGKDLHVESIPAERAGHSGSMFLSGHVFMTFSHEGDFISSGFDIETVSAIPDMPVPDSIFFPARYKGSSDTDAGTFMVAYIPSDETGTRPESTGVLRLVPNGDACAPQGPVFDLQMQNFSFPVYDNSSGPAVLRKFSMQGGYRPAGRVLEVSAMDADFGDFILSGNLDFTFPGRHDGNAGVAGRLDIRGAFGVHRLLQIWPPSLRPQAREWIRSRTETARITNAAAIFDLPAGISGTENPLPDDAVQVTFDVSDATVHFVEGVTPLSGASGKGRLGGNSFHMESVSGTIGEVSVDRGEISFPVLSPAGKPAYYRFHAEGNMHAILAVLDEEPFGFPARAGFSPGQFDGNATVQAEIVRPNRTRVMGEDYEYSATGRFDSLKLTGFTGELDLPGISGSLVLDTRSMTVKAAVVEQTGLEAEIFWNRKFYRKDGPSTISVKGFLDSSAGDLFGIPVRRFLHGTAGFSLEAVSEPGTDSRLDLSADFTDASLTFDFPGWRKEPGRPATGSFFVRFTSGGIEVGDLLVEGDGIFVSGKMDFPDDGSLFSAHIDRVFLEDRADFSLVAKKDMTGTLSLDVNGRFLDAVPLLGRPGLWGYGAGHAGAPAGKNGCPVSVSARIENILLKNDMRYTSGRLEWECDETALRSLGLFALDPDGSPVTAVMSGDMDDDGILQRMVEVRTGSAGNLLSGIFGGAVPVEDGTAVLRLYLPEKSGGVITGMLDGSDIRIVDAPVLARLFSAGSPEALYDFLKGDGISFSSVYGRFSYDGSVLNLEEGRATGPSAGMTMHGTFSDADGANIDLHGAFAPFYQVNSVFGVAPVIGDILVGRDGEGVVALSYTVRGKADSPVVIVNPLSILTPGIFRRIMEPLPDMPAE